MRPALLKREAGHLPPCRSTTPILPTPGFRRRGPPAKPPLDGGPRTFLPATGLRRTKLLPNGAERAIGVCSTVARAALSVAAKAARAFVSPNGNALGKMPARRNPVVPDEFLGPSEGPNLASRNTYFAELVRNAELELEKSLLALDYAEKRHEPVFAAVAAVAAAQEQLDRLRGGQVAENPERRAAWLAHLAKTELPVRDGPASVVPTRRQKPSAGADASFPTID